MTWQGRAGNRQHNLRGGRLWQQLSVPSETPAANVDPLWHGLAPAARSTWAQDGVLAGLLPAGIEPATYGS